MTKTFVAKPGDKWTRDSGAGERRMWLYRDGRCRIASESGLHKWYASFRGQHETDLPTPDALAQLREWGYEVSGDSVTSTTTPSGMVIETRYSFPGDYRIEHPLTESRVREIVAQMLAAQPTPAEVREAIAIANDPNTKWHDVTEPEVDHDDWRAKCKVWQPTPNSNIGEPWAAHSPSGKWSLSASSTGHILGWDLVGGVFLGRNFKTEADARAALAKAPPPPDVADFNGLKEAVAPEPDWKGLLEAVCDAADFVIDTDETPERNCSCHIHPPCSDCEEYAGRRQAIDELNAALAAAREHLARTNGGGK